MQVRFRSMNKADLSQVEKLEQQCFNMPWSKAAFANELKNKVARYIVIEYGEAIIGYGGMWVFLGEAHITNIGISPEYRRQGWGRRLIYYMMKDALNLGAARMTLEVRRSNTAAQQLYYGCGFLNVGARKGYYTDTGEDALILWNDNISNTLNELKNQKEQTV